MRRIRLVTTFLLFLVFIIALPVQAQTPTATPLELTETYTTDEGWSFNYPTAWKAGDYMNDVAEVVVVANSSSVFDNAIDVYKPGQVKIFVGSNAFLSRLGVDAARRPPRNVLNNVLMATGFYSNPDYDIGGIEIISIGPYTAAEALVSMPDTMDFLLLAVEYQPDLWALFSLSTAPNDSDYWKPTFHAIAASFSSPDLLPDSTPNVISTSNSDASFQYPKSWVAQNAGEDGIYMATDETILTRSFSVPYRGGEVRVFARINTTTQLALRMNLDVGEDASPLKFLQAEVKAARNIPGSNLSGDEKPAATTLDGKPAATIVIQANDYAEEILYMEYTPGVILRMEITTAPDELEQGEQTALSILESAQYTDQSNSS